MSSVVPSNIASREKPFISFITSKLELFKTNRLLAVDNEKTLEHHSSNSSIVSVVSFKTNYSK